ncbi:MAG TPA: hypothetical protein DCX67_11335, partial [Opitutae bacterium]|nr:hypothetical protein [Opitutae bacterium]
QGKLEREYPQLFVSNEEIGKKRNEARRELKDDPEFKKLVQSRGDAYRAQQDYLYERDEQLARLKRQLNEGK